MAVHLSEQEFDFSKSVEHALSKTLDLAKSAYVKVKAARDEHQAKQSEKDASDDAETALSESEVSSELMELKKLSEFVNDQNANKFANNPQ